MNKKIAVFFTDPGVKDYPFNKPEYWQSYQQLNEAIEEAGGEFFVVRNQSTYQGNGTFSKSWKFQDGDIVESGPVTVDVIYDKGKIEGFVSDGIPVLNSHEIDRICIDKSLTYELFSEHCPQTIVVGSESEFDDALKTIPGDRKVIKPIDDEEGNGVFIGDEDYLKQCEYSFPMLVQEFLDSSSGVPGIIEGIHDFRVAIINGEIAWAFVRTPPPGEILANISRGGKALILSPEEVPESVMAIVQDIDTYMAQFGIRYYGVDVAFTPRGPKIIELNSRLGLQENARHPVFKTLKQKLARMLVDLG